MSPAPRRMGIWTGRVSVCSTISPYCVCERGFRDRLQQMKTRTRTAIDPPTPPTTPPMILPRFAEVEEDVKVEEEGVKVEEEDVKVEERDIELLSSVVLEYLA